MKANTHFQLKNKGNASNANSVIKPRSVKDILNQLDAPQRLGMEVISDTLSEIKTYLKYCPPLARSRNHIVDPKPLAAIRWFLTSPNGGKYLAESLGLSIWQTFHDKAKPILDRAEAINPHLSSSDPDYFAAYETSTITDNDTFEDVILPASVAAVKPEQAANIPAVNQTFPFYDSYRKDGIGAGNNVSRASAHPNRYKNSQTTHSSPFTVVQCELFPDFIRNSVTARRTR
jgi:hypothetical protein